MSVAVIQGATGGLGLPLTRYILRNTGLSVVALTSKTSNRVKDDILSTVDDVSQKSLDSRLRVVTGVDLLDEKSVANASMEAELGKEIRLLACFAGELQPEKSLAQVDLAKALHTFQLNTLGHLMLYKHFVPHISTAREFAKLKGKWGEVGSQDPAKGLLGEDTAVCLSLSARVGSIGDNGKGGWYSYRAYGRSKAALNQIIRTLDHELNMRKSSALAMAYHPGTTLTSFTRPIIGAKEPDPERGLFTPPQAIDKLVNLLRQARRGDGDSSYGGQFYDWRAEKVPW